MNADRKLIKVVHVTSGDLWAGAASQFFNLALNLRDSTHLQVILLNEGVLATRLRQAGVDTVVIDETQNSTPFILTKMIRILGSIKPDILHTHCRKENILGAFAAAIFRIPCVRTLHGVPERKSNIWQLSKSIPKLLEFLLVRFVFRLSIVPSSELAISIDSRFGTCKTVVIENGIDIEETERQSQLMTQAFPAGQTGQRIAFVGRLVPVKRPDIFVEMAHQAVHMASQKHTALFYIIGDGPLANELKEMVAKLGIQESVIFTGHQDNVHHMLKNMDAVVLCSDGEGLPMALLECMVLRVPIVAHAVGEIPRLLDDGNAGILVRKQESVDYAAAVIESLESPETAKKTDNAARRVRDHYSIEKCAEKYLLAYSTIAKN